MVFLRNSQNMTICPNAKLALFFNQETFYIILGAESIGEGSACNSPQLRRYSSLKIPEKCFQIVLFGGLSISP